MPKAKQDLVKVTMNFERTDYQALRNLHPDTNSAVIIRAVLRAYISAAETKSAMLLDEIMQMP